ncbi:uncharacterized protein LOC121825287 [Peromyscus maniculatus bairdii]|uniref:uncharacterized protein LOC121825287 n=1 Tax=Peromyscus maniculatus bairdii TaxID=230844 RepID=UPI003FD17EE1
MLELPGNLNIIHHQKPCTKWVMDVKMRPDTLKMPKDTVEKILPLLNTAQQATGFLLSRFSGSSVLQWNECLLLANCHVLFNLTEAGSRDFLVPESIQRWRKTSSPSQL